MDIHERVDNAIAAHREGRDGAPSLFMLFVLVLEYLREFFREMRHSFSAIERMEKKIMFDESKIQGHVQQTADALVAIQKGIQTIRDQLAVGNDTAVQTELDRLDALVSPVALQAQGIADSFTPAPAPEPTPVPEPTPTPTDARRK